jgi:glyoxylase-like metal-dependent hydrolase (beta-lactamase superfamily II)
MAAADLPHYEILAVRYGTSSARPASQNFIMADGHDGPMPMDFYIWVIRGQGRTIVVDTGFSAGASERRNRRFVHAPAEALAQAGVDAATVQDVVITHLHWDHSGNMDLFPNATFHIQDAEMAQATGRCICHKWFRRQSEVDDVVALVKNLYAGRVKFHDGEGAVAPGVTVHLVGGHTGGLQIVRVNTARGAVVLASDSVHYWQNLAEQNPFPPTNVMDALEAFRIVEKLAGDRDRIIPGHDPLVLSRFPPLRGNLDIVRVDLAPTN